MKFAVCTTLYNAGARFVPEFMTSVSRAGVGRVVAAIDGYSGPLHFPGIDMTVVHASGSIPGARQAMLAAGRASDADILILLDMDDVLLGGAPAAFAVALEKADFAYGDLIYMSEDGTLSGETFFRNVPETISDPADILRRNFLGLGNTAIRRDMLPPLTIPQVTAVDWWIWTELLRRGLTGRATATPVVGYRQYGASTLSTFERRCKIAQEHYAAIGRPEEIERVELAMQRGPRPGVGVWYDDI